MAPQSLSDTSTSLISIGQAIWSILAIWPLAGLFMFFHSFRFCIFALAALCCIMLHYHSVVTGFAQNECSYGLNHQNEVVSSRCGGLEPSGNEYETGSFHHGS